MSIMQLNGGRSIYCRSCSRLDADVSPPPHVRFSSPGSVVAMVGKDCVAIASDLRLGNQALTIATNFEKVRF